MQKASKKGCFIGDIERKVNKDIQLVLVANLKHRLQGNLEFKNGSPKHLQIALNSKAKDLLLGPQCH